MSQETSGTVSAAHLSYFTAWKGNISFPISVSADLAPVAVMLVYTLHPSGEIIADSVEFQVEKCFKNKVRSLLFLAYSEWEGWAIYSLMSPCFLTLITFTWSSHNQHWHSSVIRRWIIKQKEPLLAAVPILGWYQGWWRQCLCEDGELRGRVGKRNKGTEIYKDLLGKDQT